MSLQTLSLWLKGFNHHFHIVNPSPWPLFTAWAIFAVIVSIMTWLRGYPHGLVVMLYAVAGLGLILACWGFEVFREYVDEEKPTVFMRQATWFAFVVGVSGFIYTFFKSDLHLAFELSTQTTRYLMEEATPRVPVMVDWPHFEVKRFLYYQASYLPLYWTLVKSLVIGSDWFAWWPTFLPLKFQTFETYMVNSVLYKVLSSTINSLVLVNHNDLITRLIEANRDFMVCFWDHRLYTVLPVEVQQAMYARQFDHFNLVVSALADKTVILSHRAHNAYTELLLSFFFNIQMLALTPGYQDVNQVELMEHFMVLQNTLKLLDGNAPLVGQLQFFVPSLWPVINYNVLSNVFYLPFLVLLMDLLFYLVGWFSTVSPNPSIMNPDVKGDVTNKFINNQPPGSLGGFFSILAGDAMVKTVLLLSFFYNMLFLFLVKLSIVPMVDLATVNNYNVLDSFLMLLGVLLFQSNTSFLTRGFNYKSVNLMRAAAVTFLMAQIWRSYLYTLPLEVLVAGMFFYQAITISMYLCLFCCFGWNFIYFVRMLNERYRHDPSRSDYLWAISLEISLPAGVILLFFGFFNLPALVEGIGQLQAFVLTLFTIKAVTLTAGQGVVANSWFWVAVRNTRIFRTFVEGVRGMTQRSRDYLNASYQRVLQNGRAVNWWHVARAAAAVGIYYTPKVLLITNIIAWLPPEPVAAVRSFFDNLSRLPEDLRRAARATEQAANATAQAAAQAERTARSWEFTEIIRALGAYAVYLYNCLHAFIALGVNWVLNLMNSDITDAVVPQDPQPPGNSKNDENHPDDEAGGPSGPSARFDDILIIKVVLIFLRCQRKHLLYG